MLITSLDNDRIKKYVKLQENKKYRDELGLFIVEGEHLVEEAYKSNLIEEVIVLENEIVNFDCEIVNVTKEILKKISLNESVPSIMALCKKKEEKSLGDKVLILDNIQDPGNLGTIIRSSVAFGISDIILSDDTVDLYNPKVIRSTEGMLFYINIVRRNIIDEINRLKNNNYIIYGTNVDNGIDVREVSEKNKYALIMGNEGNGIKEEVLDLCDEYLYITIKDNCESLNVGVATSILLYELNR